MVEFKIIGGDISIERELAESLKELFIQLVKNSIDHGIESPSKRVKLGKSEIGLITLQVSQIKGSLVIVFGFLMFGRLGSNIEHIQKPLASINRIIKNPIGYGVGMAGPVSMRFPADGSASKIAENWYLQITEEVGILGLFILIIICNHGCGKGSCFCS